MKLSTIGALLLVLGACSHAPMPPEDARTAALDRYLTARTNLGRWSGSVLVAVGDRVVLRKGYGYADVAKKLPYAPETPQPVASISKMFTALAALKLRDRGVLSLDDSLCKFIDDCPDAWRPVTIGHLIHHRSGIPDYEERLELGSEAYMALMTRPGASAKILADARTRPLDFPPGSKFHYSNTGYVALSFALEKASGEGFAKLVGETVLRPAGMTHARVLDAGPMPPETAVGYTHGDLGWARTMRGVALTEGHLQSVPPLALTPPQGDAWLEATVDDLLAFSRAIEGAPVEPAVDGYGAGWIVDRAFEHARMRHNGIVPGYASEFIRFPDEKITIVLLSNLDRVRLSRVARDVSAIALGQPYDMPVHGEVVELSVDQIARLTGSYRLSDGRTIEVRKDPDLLVAEMKGQYIAGLIPLSPTEMYVPLADGKAIFTLDPGGRASSVNMRFGGTDQIAQRE